MVIPARDWPDAVTRLPATVVGTIGFVVIQPDTHTIVVIAVSITIHGTTGQQ